MTKGLVGAALGLASLVAIGSLGATGAQPAAFQTGGFAPGADVGLNPEQMAQATRALGVADHLKAGPLPVLAMVVGALGESMFRPVPNGHGSGYCGVFQADPDNVPCDDTEEQAKRFLIGGKGFQSGGAIKLAKANPEMTPGTIATFVEASGKPGSFYDAHRGQAEQIIAAWRAGVVGTLAVGSATAAQILANPNVHMTPGQRADMASGGIDRRLLATLAFIAARHHIIITALRRDHSPGTNHEAGRAADIGAVDMHLCHGERTGPCAAMLMELTKVRGPDRCTECIYLWDADPADPGFFARSDHDDHVHVGFDG